MKDQLIVKELNAVPFEKTNHLQGQKQLLLRADECESNLTQAAVGMLLAGEAAERHVHPTMEEFFFVQDGTLRFDFDDQFVLAQAGTFIKIPAAKWHALIAIEDARFLYWGVKV